MKFVIVLLLFLYGVTPLAKEYKKQSSVKISDVTYHDASITLDRGIKALLKMQNPDGSWTQSHDPSVTSIALVALTKSGPISTSQEVIAAIHSGRTFLLQSMNEEGFFSESEHKHPNYTSILALYALSTLDRAEDQMALKKLRKFLIGFRKVNHDDKEQAIDSESQSQKELKLVDNPSKEVDLASISDKTWALDALFTFDYLRTEFSKAPKADLEKGNIAWEEATKFISAVEGNTDKKSKQWVVKSEQDSYALTDESEKENEKNDTTSVKGLQSHGKMSYIAMRSMLYTPLKKTDFRVVETLDWARKHYDLNENPEMGFNEYYFYLLCFAKAHSSSGSELVMSNDGQIHYWRQDIIQKLLSIQERNNTWINNKENIDSESFLCENNVELSTAYALLTLEFALNFLGYGE